MKEFNKNDTNNSIINVPIKFDYQTHSDFTFNTIDLYKGYYYHLN